MKVNISNYKTQTPDILLDLLTANKAEIIEESIEGLVEIGKFLFQVIRDAVANGTRIQRIRALEESDKLQLKINIKVAQELKEQREEIERIKQLLP